MAVLKTGCRGDEVKALQTLLRRYDPTIEPDGYFGPKTERAAQLAQRRLGLFPADGLVGPKTMGALRAQVAKRTTSGGWLASAERLAAEALSAATGAAREVSDWVSGLWSSATAIPTILRRSVAPVARRAVTGPMPDGVASSPINMRLSPKGRDFIFQHEA